MIRRIFTVKYNPSSYDAATLAWVAAVIANGGTVSDARKILVDALIVGLKGDGVWTKLDRLWLFAAENTASALTDIVADQLATSHGSTISFTIDRGYQGTSSSSDNDYIDSGFNPTTAGSPKFIQDSAMLAAWSGTNSATTNDFLVGNLVDFTCQIDPREADNKGYFDINSGSSFGFNVIGVTDSTGWWAGDRNAASGTGCLLGYQNGSQVATGSTASTTPTNSNIIFMGSQASYRSSRQSCAGAIGGHLTGTDHANLYTRLRTYMTAVGVS